MATMTATNAHSAMMRQLSRTKAARSLTGFMLAHVTRNRRYNDGMKPIVVRDPAKFDQILGKMIAAPPEKQKDMKLPKAKR
jgi:hypothetical protein